MIFPILAAGLILRLLGLDQSLWLDEAINVNVAGSLDFIPLITQYSLGDFHPPLYHVILRSWILLFGSSEIVVRIPSVIFAIGSIFTAYLITKNLFDKKTALIAATLVATAPLHIYYSQEARMYMLAAFLAGLSVYFFLALLEKDKLINWIGFILATSLMLYSDYLPYLLLPVYLIFLYIYRRKVKRSTLKSFLPAFIIIFLTITPWLILLPQQLSGGLQTAQNSPAWARVVGAPQVSSLILTFVKFTIGRISIDNNLIYAILFSPIALFVTVLFIISTFRLSHHRTFLWYWFFAPIFMSFAIAFFVPIYAYFRLLFVLPAFYIIWAAAITTINWSKLIRILLLIALIINIGATVIYLENPKFQRENWKEAYLYVESHLKPKSVVLFEADYPAAPFDYYNSKQIEAYGALSNFHAREDEVEKKVKLYTTGKVQVFLFQYLTGITDPEGLVFRELSNQGYRNVQTKDFNGVGFLYEFEK